MTHHPARQPDGLYAIRPAPVVVVGHGDAADLPGVPEYRPRFPPELVVCWLVGEHEQLSGVVLLVCCDSGGVGEEEGGEGAGFGAEGCGLGQDGAHFGGPVGVPV